MKKRLVSLDGSLNYLVNKNSILNKKLLHYEVVFCLVDFDMSFINRLATELQYLVWVLKGDYEKV